MNENYYGVIMAGGIGSRFWPMSKSSHPKQFMDILGTGKSLLQQTFHRLSKVCPPDHILIVTNKIYRKITLEQLPGISPNQVLCEPERRNTAPCIGYAYMKIAAGNPKASVVVTPSDHLILDDKLFTQTLSDALNYAGLHEELVTVGVKPTRPDTGYGYIHFNKGESGFCKVRSFTEKPDLEKARSFLKSGDYSWNTGLFVFGAKTIDQAFQKYLPKTHHLLREGRNLYNTPDEQTFIDRVYGSCDNISIDYGVLEKAENVIVINAGFDWSDLGTWGSLYEHIPRDENGNALVGNIMAFHSGKNIVHAQKGKLVVLQGLHDFIVVDHEDALLICHKEEEQQIKQIVERLSGLKGKNYT